MIGTLRPVPGCVPRDFHGDGSGTTLQENGIGVSGGRAVPL